MTSTSEHEVKLQARVIAMEFLLTSYVASTMAAASEQDVDDLFEALRVHCAKQTIPGLPPEISDYFTQEITEAFERLAEKTKAHWQAKQSEI